MVCNWVLFADTNEIKIPLPMQDQSVEQKEINLQTAIYMSLERNPQVVLRYLDVETRQGQLQSASGEFDWNTIITAEANKTRSPSITLSGAPDTLVEETISYTIGAIRKFRNGLSLTPSVSANLNNNSKSNPRNTSFAVYNLELLIPLLRGLGERSSRAIEASLERDLEAARLAYLQVLSDQAFLTLVAYWNCAAARVRVNLLSDLEKRAQALIETTEAMIEADLLSYSALPQARANLNDQRSLYIQALSEYASTRFDLASELGLEPDEMVNVPVPSTMIKKLDTASNHVLKQAPHEFISLALTKRSDLLSARETLEARGILFTAAKVDLKPRLDLKLYTGYTTGNYEYKPIRVLQDNPRGANAGVALNFDWPWNNDFREGILVQRRAEFDRANYLIYQLQQNIARDTLKAAEIMKLDSARALLSQDTVRQYKESVDIASQRLAAGNASVFEVIDMEGRYSRSTIQQVNALRDYYISVGRLRYVSGTIFQKLDGEEGYILNALDDSNIFAP